jgi:hypothetical protein
MLSWRSFWESEMNNHVLIGRLFKQKSRSKKQITRTIAVGSQGNRDLHGIVLESLLSEEVHIVPARQATLPKISQLLTKYPRYQTQLTVVKNVHSIDYRFDNVGSCQLKHQCKGNISTFFIDIVNWVSRYYRPGS